MVSADLHKVFAVYHTSQLSNYSHAFAITATTQLREYSRLLANAHGYGTDIEASTHKSVCVYIRIYVLTFHVCQPPGIIAAPVIYEDAAWVLERMVSFYTVMHWLFLAETPHVSCPTSLSSSSPISYTSPSRSPSKMNSVFDSHLNERLLVDCLETLLNVYTAQRQTKAYANLQKQGGSTRVGKGTNNPDNINDVGGKSDSGGKINEAAVGDERDAKWAERELRFIAVSLLLKLPQPPSQLSSSLQQALVLVKASSTAANAVNAASASITGTADGCAMPPLLAFVLEAYSNYHSPNLVRFLRQVLRCFNAISSSLSSSPSSPSLPSPSSCLQTSASIHKDPLLFLLVSRFASSCQLQLLLHMNRAYMKGRTWLGGDHIVQQLGFFFGARQAVEFAHSLHSFPVQMQAETSSVVPQSQSQSQVQIQSQSQLQSEIQLQAQYCVEEKTPQVSFKIGFNNPARAALLAAKHDSKSLNKSTSSGGTEDIEQEDYEREVRALILLNCVQARRSGDCDVGGEHYGKPTSYETKDGRLLWSFDRIKTRVHSVSGPLPHSLYLASNSGQIEGKKKARDVMNRMSVRQLLISWIQHA